MKVQHNITQIAQVLGRDKSTISRELRSNAGVEATEPKKPLNLSSNALNPAAKPARLRPLRKSMPARFCGCNGDPSR